MPLVTVDIQETGRDRWVAEFEAGGVVARREQMTATSFDEIMLKIVDAHARLVPPALPPRPVGPDRPIDRALLPPKIPVPLSRRQAHDARVRLEEEHQRVWEAARKTGDMPLPTPIDRPIEEHDVSGTSFMLGTVPTGTFGQDVFDVLQRKERVAEGDAPVDRRKGPRSLTFKQAQREKRMARAADRQARSAANAD